MRTLFIIISLTLIMTNFPKISGNHHDKVPQSKEQHNESIIGGGDHDKRPHGPVIGGDDHDDWQKHRNESIIGGGDHDKRPHGPVIGGDDHDDWQKHRNESIIGGGDHDKKPHDPLIGGDDHDIIAYKVVTLTNFLNSKSIEELREYALKVEEWRRNVKGEHFMGGIHDYINTVGQDKIVSYILSSSMQYPELLEEETFLKVIAPAVKNEENHNQAGGLHDFIFRLDRDTLVSFAFAAEKYHNDKDGSFLIGGLHDVIYRMSEIEIAEYIINVAKNYPELDSYSVLHKLAVEYGFSKSG